MYRGGGVSFAQRKRQLRTERTIFSHVRQPLDIDTERNARSTRNAGSSHRTGDVGARSFVEVDEREHSLVGGRWEVTLHRRVATGPYSNSH